MGATSSKSFKLVLVENNDDDVFFIERALRRAGYSPSLTRLLDGQHAIEYFSTLGQDGLPDLVMLDLQMPRKNGFQVLSWLREHPSYVKLPIMMLTSSEDPLDVRKAKNLGATDFITKKPHCRDVIEVLDRFFPHLDGE
jgi:CheY-like chemotaxis protein